MLLSSLIILPLLVALALLMIKNDDTIRWTSLVASVALFFSSLLLLFKFDKSTPDLQMVEYFNWLPEYGISYYLGVDGISLFAGGVNCVTHTSRDWGQLEGD